MKTKKIAIILFVLILQIQQGFSQNSIPHLQRIGDKTHLVVDGKPFIVFGGELGNSSFTCCA